ncbi:Spy/CpxP family protein refolding chaperone [Ottowia testudinis]|uniref:Spy/CpxP family protein refolding chaperone n=1 Tax=Ottowia testudinis TaxID=2816950 RepID=A0A975H3N4_9BURK|nr:Spy/CpxP family protein refolding chaperone [Ottowia testudinis]QTD45465.1 Spy/CpxP family protein refolding chaperone [Ottowia testudinis]
MTQQPKRLFIIATLATLGAVAMAQTPPPAGHAPAAGEASATRPAPGDRRGRMDPAQMQQRMAERHAQRMADLKAQLKLNPSQEGAWNTYSAAMQPPANLQRQRMARAEFAKLTAPQRIDHMQQRGAERQAQMKQRGDAVKAFYAQLTPEQQKVYDERAMRGGPGEGKRGGGRHGHHSMGPGPR